MGQTPTLLVILMCCVLTITGCTTMGTLGQQDFAASPSASSAPRVPALPAVPPPQPEDRPLPINLPTALQLANAQAVDIAAAAERIQVAAAVLEEAHVAWLPTVTLGGDYARHDGRNQDNQGNVFDNSRSSIMFGAGTGIGPAAILNVSEAIFAPLVARQQLKAREAESQAASNDTLVAVSDAYFNVQQARGELAGAADAIRRTEELVRRTRKLAPALVPDLETFRAEAELARRQQTELLARERWKVTSAELLRVLRLEPSAQVEPMEPPHLRMELIALDRPVDDLISIALSSRPELASQQAQAQATLALLKQERLRPLIPSVLLRGFSTPVTGTLAGGVFAGGANGRIGDPGLRGDLDLQVLWQMENLGLGNRAQIHRREAENRLAVIDLFRVQDRVAAEVAQAYAQAQLAARRVEVAERGLRSAFDSADKNLIALGQTMGIGNQVVLLVRPQEAVAAVQALSQSYADYYTAVADANRAQFHLYRALGRPAQCLVQVDQVPKLCAPSALLSVPLVAPAVETNPGSSPSPVDPEKVEKSLPIGARGRETFGRAGWHGRETVPQQALPQQPLPQQLSVPQQEETVQEQPIPPVLWVAPTVETTPGTRASAVDPEKVEWKKANKAFPTR